MSTTDTQGPVALCKRLVRDLVPGPVAALPGVDDEVAMILVIFVPTV